jgi:hypothetical protein
MKLLFSCNIRKIISPLMILLCLSFSCSSAFWGNLTYSCTANSASSAFTVPSTAVCGNGYTSSIIYSKPQSSSDPDPDVCSHLSSIGVDYGSIGQYQKEYDTLKAYIELCPLDKDAYHAFPSTTNAVNGLEQQGDTIWAKYRDWLRTVLYYNPDTVYYCSDLFEYAKAFMHQDELGNYANFKTGIAILKFIGDSANCYAYGLTIPDAWKADRRIWKDTVTDSLKTPFDTTLPNIDQINHGWLRGFKAGVDNGISSIVKDALGSLAAEENPFTDELKLKYSLLNSAVTKIEVFDALGTRLWSDGQGYQEVGEHLLKINTSGWSSGTYYARLMTLQGEVKTVKMVKE